MIGNNEKRLLDIAEKAPWLAENEGPLYPLTVDVDTGRIIEDLIACEPTIINDNGAVCQRAKVSKVDAQKLVVDIPSNWDDSAPSFHVIFRNRDGQWNSFAANNTSDDLSCISITVPEKVHYWQKRRYKRVAAPLGTRAIVRDIDKGLRTMHIRDLSIGGMLACYSSPINKFPVGAYVNEVLVYIDQNRSDVRDPHPRKILPMIDHGKVARSFVDQTSGIVHYGILFELESDYVRDNYARLIEEIEHGAYS